MKNFVTGEKNWGTLPIKLGRYIVVDTETTGSSEEDHIIEIAAVEIRNGRLTGNQFNGFLKPRIKINKKAIAVHHMNDNFYSRNYEMFEDDSKSILQSFLDFIKSSLIFAHNARFDSSMLNKELKYWGLPEIPNERFRCTVRIFKNIVKDKYQKASLVKCCEYFNIEKNDKLFHSALYDTIMCSKVLIMMFDYDNFLRYKENIRKSTERSYISAIHLSNDKIEIINEDKKNFILRESSNLICKEPIKNETYTPLKKPSTSKSHINFQFNNPYYESNYNEEEEFIFTPDEINKLLASELKHTFKSEYKQYKITNEENKDQYSIDQDAMITDNC